MKAIIIYNFMFSLQELMFFVDIPLAKWFTFDDDYCYVFSVLCHVCMNKDVLLIHHGN